jgi:hypothetical protein
MQDRAVGLEPETIAGRTEMIGRDPRDMTPAEFQGAGSENSIPGTGDPRPMPRSLCGATRRGSALRFFGCPSWPWRMGTNPWRAKRTMSPGRKAVQLEVLAKARAARVVLASSVAASTRGGRGYGQEHFPDGAARG